MERRFVVVGAGVFGSWTAYILRRLGHEVLLLDQYGPANSRASSGGETRIIRAGYGPKQVYTNLAVRALPLWVSFFEKIGRPLLYRTGVLWLDGDDSPYVQGSDDALRSAGVDHELLSQEEIERRYPQMRLESHVAGLFEPQAGAILARQAVHALVDDFVNLGGVYHHAEIMQPAGNGHLAAVRTASGEQIHGDAFVFACGPWLGKVFPDLLGSKVIPSRQEVIFFGIPPGDKRFSTPQLPIWIDCSGPRKVYGLPDLDGRGFKVACDVHGEPFDPDNGERIVSQKGVSRAREYVTRRFPALADAPIVETRVCQYENTDNVDFLIDRHTDFENLWLVGGGSGHGFKHGPAIGEYAAARVTGSATPAIEERFSIASKQEFDPRILRSSL